MAANASVELGGYSLGGVAGSAIHGNCVRQETLAISGSTATLATAVTAAEAADGVTLARVTTDDTACYVAVGAVPDPSSAGVTKTGSSRARRFLPAGATIELPIGIGEKVAVHS